MTIDLERLIGELPERRWFGAKGTPVEGVDLLDEAIVVPGDPGLRLALVRVRLAGGEQQTYQLPILAHETVDAFERPEAIANVPELMCRGAAFEGAHGTFRFSGPGLDPLAPPQGSVRFLGADQSNSSVVFDDDDIILKFFRRVQVGPNPDVELSRVLTSVAFEHVPPHVGEISYEGPDGTIDLGIAQHYLRDSEEGWAFAVRYLHALLDAVDPADAPEDRRFLIDERAGRLLAGIEELGDVIAGLHVALAREEADPEFAPEPMDPNDLKELAESVRSSMARLAAGDDELSGWAGAVDARLDALLELPGCGDRIRVHGDLHLGQVIVTGRGWMVLDLEGEPLRPIEERRAKRSPLRDVAGMLRSFDYAAAAVLFERAQPGDDVWTSLEPWAREWEQAARDRFLSAYISHAQTEGAFLPEDRDAIAALLDAFEIEKAIYEIAYERGHRPEWERIPRRGLQRLLDRSEAR